MNTLPNLIVRLSHDPFNSDLNFDVAKEYLRLNQTASAVSFFLRCVEYGGENSDAVYASLCAMARCFDDQKGREYSVTNCLFQALAYDESRPEAWFLLSQFYERAGNWQEAYTFGQIGYNWALGQPDALPIELGYYGSYCLKFQMGIAAWWIGRKQEAIDRLTALANDDTIAAMYRDASKYNLEKLNAGI
jgi:hypothetical protein